MHIGSSPRLKATTVRLVCAVLSQRKCLTRWCLNAKTRLYGTKNAGQTQATTVGPIPDSFLFRPAAAEGLI